MTESTSAQGSFLEKYGTPIAVLLGALILAGAYMFSDKQPVQPGAPGPVTGPVDVKEVQTDGSPYLGSPTAPLTMAYWFDYQCPFCKMFETQTMGKIYDEYVVTGKLRIVLKDFQFLGPDSDDAALVARAVWDAYPDRFYDWYKAIFEAQDEEHGGFGNLESVLELTATVSGIDGARIERLVEEHKTKYQAAITADREEGSKLGVGGTPAMIIGTELLGGAQPYDDVVKTIEEQLQK